MLHKKTKKISMGLLSLLTIVLSPEQLTLKCLVTDLQNVIAAEGKNFEVQILPDQEIKPFAKFSIDLNQNKIAQFLETQACGSVPTGFVLGSIEVCKYTKPSPGYWCPLGEIEKELTKIKEEGDRLASFLEYEMVPSEKPKELSGFGKFARTQSSAKKHAEPSFHCGYTLGMVQGMAFVALGVKLGIEWQVAKNNNRDSL